MSDIIIITRGEGRDPIAVGPFRSENVATIRARELNERFADSFDYNLASCAATVVPLERQSGVTNDELVEFLR